MPFSAPDAVACKTRPRISGNRASAVGCGRKSLLVFTCTSAASELLRRASSLSRASPRQPFAAPHSDWVEVSGTANGPCSIISPLSETECYFYRAILPRRLDCQETLCVAFFLDDGTGRLLIDPRGAQTDLQPSFSEDVEWDSAPDYIRHFLSRHAVRSGQVVGYCIRANDLVTGTPQDSPAIGQRNENSVRSSQARGLAYLSPEAADGASQLSRV